MSQIITGHFEADGNDVTLPLGFVPNYLEVVNSDAAKGEVIKIEWWYNAGITKELHHYSIEEDTSQLTPKWETSGEIEAVVAPGDSPTVSNANSLVQVTGEMGVKIDASFMDNSDEVYYMAIRSDRDIDHGDINA